MSLDQLSVNKLTAGSIKIEYRRRELVRSSDGSVTTAGAIAVLIAKGQQALIPSDCAIGRKAIKNANEWLPNLRG